MSVRPEGLMGQAMAFSGKMILVRECSGGRGPEVGTCLAASVGAQ